MTVAISTADLTRLDFVPLRDPAHVKPYHEIRRIELFERYEPGTDYAALDLADDAPNHLGHVLLLDGEVVGTLRIDLIDHERAGFRLVAVKGAYKNRGFGAVMLARGEALVAAFGRGSIVVNASHPAANFYRRHGYTEGPWLDVRPYNPQTQVRLGTCLSG